MVAETTYDLQSMGWVVSSRCELHKSYSFHHWSVFISSVMLTMYMKWWTTFLNRQNLLMKYLEPYLNQLDLEWTLMRWVEVVLSFTKDVHVPCSQRFSFCSLFFWSEMLLWQVEARLKFDWEKRKPLGTAVPEFSWRCLNFCGYYMYVAPKKICKSFLMLCVMSWLVKN